MKFLPFCGKKTKGIENHSELQNLNFKPGEGPLNVRSGKWSTHGDDTTFLNRARDDSKRYAVTKAFFPLKGRADIT